MQPQLTWKSWCRAFLTSSPAVLLSCQSKLKANLFVDNLSKLLALELRTRQKDFPSYGPVKKTGASGEFWLGG